LFDRTVDPSSEAPQALYTALRGAVQQSLTSEGLNSEGLNREGLTREGLTREERP
jgi:hypothetical protein